MYFNLVLKKYDLDNEKLKQGESWAESQKKEFEEKLSVATNNIKSLEQNVQEKMSKIKVLENRK